jgi:hypothetical protein
VTSTGGEAAPWRGKGGDDANLVDMNFTESKNKENLHGRFNCYKWMVNVLNNDELIYFKKTYESEI